MIRIVPDQTLASTPACVISNIFINYPANPKPLYIKKIIDRTFDLFNNKKCHWEYDRKHKNDLKSLFYGTIKNKLNGDQRVKRSEFVRSCRILMIFFAGHTNLNPNYDKLTTLEIKTLPISIISKDTGLCKTTVCEVLKFFNNIGLIRSQRVSTQNPDLTWDNHPSRRWLTDKFLSILGLLEPIQKNINKRTKKLLKITAPKIFENAYKAWVPPKPIVKASPAVAKSNMSDIRAALGKHSP